MIEKWRDCAKLQNIIIKEEGEIQRDDKRIWGLILHEWDNEDWLEVLRPMGTLIEQFPEFAEPYHVQNIREATEAIVANKKYHSRVLDTKQHKKKAWKALMTAREIWNRAKAEA
jgi:hypothetical protein|tara:strand:- start:45 stop:386 length:342 start_codon:yes stop_codon:yes gene_type:complete